MARRNRALRRDRRLVGLLSAVGLAAGGASGVHVSKVQMPPPQVIAADVSPGLDRQLTIGFVGDTMIGDGALKLVAKRGVAAPLAKVSGLLNADFVIANHEAPLTIRPSTSLARRYNYAGLPMSAQALRVTGIDALSLSNNHIMDRGVNGLIDTRKYARRSAC